MHELFLDSTVVWLLYLVSVWILLSGPNDHLRGHLVLRGRVCLHLQCSLPSSLCCSVLPLRLQRKAKERIHLVLSGTVSVHELHVHFKDVTVCSIKGYTCKSLKNRDVLILVIKKRNFSTPGSLQISCFSQLPVLDSFISFAWWLHI